MLLTYFLLLLGFAVLIKGADFLVDGASSIAKKNGISNLAIGLTVVAFGTSAPEMIVSVLSALGGRSDASFGNVIGSNNFNLLMILGVAGLIFPLVVQRNTVKYEVPISIGAIVLVFVLINDRMLFSSEADQLSRLDASVLLVFFTLFLLYIYRTMKHSSEVEEQDVKIYGTPLSIAMSVFGIAMLVGGGKLVVDSAVTIAQQFGLSERLIGLTILAAGTSLPELATSAVAAYRKSTDIAIGNVIGSNIFNLFLILGITGLVHPIGYNSALNFDLYVLLSATIMLLIFMFTLNTRKLDRWEAFLLLAGYVSYTTYLIQVG